MDPSSVPGLVESYGLYFDPATGKSYRDDGSDTGFTFEHARWTGPFGLDLNWPWLNPFSFATHETGVKMQEFVRRHTPLAVTVTLAEEQTVFGPFTRTIERGIVVSDGGRKERLSAGMLANSVIRNGETSAAIHFLAELRLAGLPV